MIHNSGESSGLVVVAEFISETRVVVITSEVEDAAARAGGFDIGIVAEQLVEARLLAIIAGNLLFPPADGLRDLGFDGQDAPDLFPRHGDLDRENAAEDTECHNHHVRHDQGRKPATDECCARDDPGAQGRCTAVPKVGDFIEPTELLPLIVLRHVPSFYDQHDGEGDEAEGD